MLRRFGAMCACMYFLPQISLIPPSASRQDSVCGGGDVGYCPDVDPAEEGYGVPGVNMGGCPGEADRLAPLLTRSQNGHT